ncbi:MAG: hypothetical protein PHW10_04920, partial [Candidatus Peribacteraceae bacterium]|nr:hypothetical protein [Candidatus Peribacteraceae bacterium]
MMTRLSSAKTETSKKRLLQRRMIVVYGFFLLLLAIVVARLMDLQVLRGEEYRAVAQSQHYGGVKLPAKRGEILASDSKTGDSHILATNTTLDLVYVDPLITSHPTEVAEMLSDMLLTEEVHGQCSEGADACPRELVRFYEGAFDPLTQYHLLHSGALLEPVPVGGVPPPALLKLPDFAEARRLFARDIERRISEKRVTFAPLKYGATKREVAAVKEMGIPGIEADAEQRLVYANPEAVPQQSLSSVARALTAVLQLDAAKTKDLLRSRPLRYVAVMRRLPPALSLKIKEEQVRLYREAAALERETRKRGEGAQEVDYLLRSVALIPEHWRFYPDGTIASHVVGFLNTNQEPQYGVERTYNAQLRGQEGLISTVSDPHGGQILTSDQTIIQPRDGDTVVLTIDRAIQRETEAILAEAVTRFEAESGEALVLDPRTGRILAMANAPLFDSNNYAMVYQKEPIELNAGKRKEIVVEIYHPDTGARVVKAYYDDVFTGSGRLLLSEKIRKTLEDLEQLYGLEGLTRYFLYVGQTLRMEVFPTDKPGLWLKY